LKREEIKRQKEKRKARERVDLGRQYLSQLVRQEEERKIQLADLDPSELCQPGEIEPNRFVATIQEELENQKLWCRLLSITDPISESTTLRDLCRRTYYEWHRQGRPLFNPLAKRLAPIRRKVIRPKSFKKTFQLVEPQADYDRPLSEIDPTVKKTAERPEAPSPKAHKPEDPTEAQLWERIRQNPPIAFFSTSKIEL
jgi:hypothetical protein